MSNKKIFEGVVCSDASDKTIVVRVTRLVKHKLLKKYHKLSTKFHVHDETNSAKTGDHVTFYSTRPISKKKAFMLEKVLEK